MTALARLISESSYVTSYEPGMVVSLRLPNLIAGSDRPTLCAQILTKKGLALKQLITYKTSWGSETRKSIRTSDERFVKQKRVELFREFNLSWRVTTRSTLW